jgi:hypothetical protein
MAFDKVTRRRLLDEYGLLYSAVNDLSYAEVTGFDTRDDARLFEAQRRLVELAEAYESSLPRFSLSRCPFSGEPLAWSIDDFGLDGLWWNHEAPVRAQEAPLPTFLALTGGVQLATPLEWAPFLVAPGPGAPCVCRRMFEDTPVKAVISSLGVGVHTAYAVAYFSASRAIEVRCPNLWGMSYYEFLDEEGRYGWYESFDLPSAWDFNLAPWIASGRLLWIAPRDPELKLHAEIEGCPYVNLPGAREDQHIYCGKVTVGTPNEEDAR